MRYIFFRYIEEESPIIAINTQTRVLYRVQDGDLVKVSLEKLGPDKRILLLYLLQNVSMPLTSERAAKEDANYKTTLSYLRSSLLDIAMPQNIKDKDEAKVRKSELITMKNRKDVPKEKHGYYLDDIVILEPSEVTPLLPRFLGDEYFFENESRLSFEKIKHLPKKVLYLIVSVCFILTFVAIWNPFGKKLKFSGRDIDLSSSQLRRPFQSLYYYNVDGFEVTTSSDSGEQLVSIKAKIDIKRFDGKEEGTGLSTIIGSGTQKHTTAFLTYTGQLDENPNIAWDGAMLVYMPDEGDYILYFLTRNSFEEGDYLFGEVIIERERVNQRRIDP